MLTRHIGSDPRLLQTFALVGLLFIGAAVLGFLINPMTATCIVATALLIRTVCW